MTENRQSSGTESIHNAHRQSRLGTHHRQVNLVLLGALCKDMGSDKEAWEKAIAACVKEKLLAVNLKAFEMGYNY